MEQVMIPGHNGEMMVRDFRESRIHDILSLSFLGAALPLVLRMLASAVTWRHCRRAQRCLNPVWGL
jgi:hypothetical protein